MEVLDRRVLAARRAGALGAGVGQLAFALDTLATQAASLPMLPKGGNVRSANGPFGAAERKAKRASVRADREPELVT